MSRLRPLAERTLRGAGRLGQADARTCRDLLRATIELAIARWRIATSKPSDLIEPRPARRRPAENPDASATGRVAFAITAMGARVPWRSDCLVQALAGHRWLARLGIASDLNIGVRRAAGAPIQAHAWLKVGGDVLIGGDVADYSPLIGDN